MKHWRWAAGLTAGFGLLFAAILVGLIAWGEREGVATINARLTEIAPWLLLWRIGLFSALIVYWRELAGWATRTFALDAESGTALIRWRWRAATGLVLMDLVLVEDLIGTLQRVIV